MTIPNKENACRIIDSYPENYYKSKIIENWNCVELPSIVNQRPTWAWGGTVPRSTFDTNPKLLFWFPDRRIKQTIQMLDLTADIPLSDDEHDITFITKWKELIYLVTDFFRATYANKSSCIHGGIFPHKVTKKEMLQTFSMHIEN